ncbi:hypothetical protein [Acetomicrobium sp.]|nr:hypothetical protein [Acetomicrobium sp.]MDR9770601.1 hypothetical protein [Acetomicrobium sp.]
MTGSKGSMVFGDVEERQMSGEVDSSVASMMNIKAQMGKEKRK